MSTQGRGCTVCASPNRDLIESALAIGRTQAAVAKAYGVHYGAVQRHAKNHANKALAKVAGPELHSTPVQTGTEVVEDRRPAIEQLTDKLRETQAVYARAAAGGNLTAALVALKQEAVLIEQIARLRGEFVPPPPKIVDLTTTSEWVKLRSKILKALEDDPDAKQKVADAL
jgi:hypothetical protein